MWAVEMESIEAERDLEHLISSGQLSDEDQIVISEWTRKVMFYGPESLRTEKRWADHALSGDWWGYRSSSFSVAGRIIYRIEGESVMVRVARITPSHNYRPR